MPTVSRTADRVSAAMSRAAPRIALFGLFGSGNFGNDGSLEAMITFLRRGVPGADLVCICGSPEPVENTHRLRAVSMMSPDRPSRLFRIFDRLLAGAPHKILDSARAFRVMRGFDAMIVPGTGILDDFGTGPLGMPYTLLMWCLAARLYDAQLAFVSIGAGPIRHPVSRRLMKAAIGLAQYRSYRDTVSKDYLRGIGFPATSDPVFPDLAFKLDAPAAVPHAPDRPLTVGVGVMAYYGWKNDRAAGAGIFDRYFATITDFVLWLIDQGHYVQILVGEVGDRDVAIELMQVVRSKRAGLAEERLATQATSSLHDLMAQISKTDVVVATRFHNVVCALRLGRPTVSIGYADKNDALMAEMGLDEFCQHIERLDFDLLVQQFSRLVSDRDLYEERIRDANIIFQSRLNYQEGALKLRLLGRI